MVKEVVADVPVGVNQTHAVGVCNSTTQMITLSFFDGWQLMLSFTRNETDDEYHMTHASLSYSFKPGHPPFFDAAAYMNKSGLFLCMVSGVQTSGHIPKNTVY